MKIDSILILAAGLGTRLKPYTNDLPKVLLPLGDTNLLRNLIQLSQQYFATAKVYINASYMAEKIINEVALFPPKKRPYIIWEPKPLGPAFTVSQHCKVNDHNVLVLHGDTYFSDVSFSQFAYSVNLKNNDVSILLCHERIKSEARSQIFEANGVVKEIAEISASDTSMSSAKSIDAEKVWSSSGALVIKRNSLVNFAPKRNVGLSPTLINYIAYSETLYLEKCSAYRISIDSEKSYLEALEFQASSPKLFDRAIR